MKRKQKLAILSAGLAALIGVLLISPARAADEGIIFVDPTDLTNPENFEYLQLQVTGGWNFTINLTSESGEAFWIRIYTPSQFDDFRARIETGAIFESPGPLAVHSYTYFASDGDQVLYLLLINENDYSIQINYEYGFETVQAIPGYSVLTLSFAIFAALALILRNVNVRKKRN